MVRATGMFLGLLTIMNSISHLQEQTSDRRKYQETTKQHKPLITSCELTEFLKCSSVKHAATMPRKELAP